MAETKRTILERIDWNTKVLVQDLLLIRADVQELVGLVHELLTLAKQTKAGITMANAAIEELIGAFNTATNDIAARIDRLTQGLADQVSPEQLTELNAIRDHLVQLGQDPANPVPAPQT